MLGQGQGHQVGVEAGLVAGEDADAHAAQHGLADGLAAGDLQPAPRLHAGLGECLLGQAPRDGAALAHDQVLALTSHLPHLIAYTIVGTATDLGDKLKKEVFKFSAGGFRDFTRIAASDPVMWRDIFLNNKDALLDVLGRFTEDLTALKRAISRGEEKALEDHFTRTRDIRRGIIDAKQD